MRDRERDDETPLDRALGDALREMVSGEGPEDMRRRVLAGLSPASRRPGFPYRLAWAAGVAGAVVALVVLVRPERQARSPRHVVSAPLPSSEATPAPPPQAAASPVVPPAPESRRGGGFATRAESVPLVEALPNPEPVDTAPLTTQELGFRRLMISGLEVSILDVEPLEPS